MNGDPILLFAAVVFGAFALFTTVLILFLRALADTFAPVINYCASHGEQRDSALRCGRIAGYWYNPSATATAKFFAGRTGMPNPGEAIPGIEGVDWGSTRCRATPDADDRARAVHTCLELKGVAMQWFTGTEQREALRTFAATHAPQGAWREKGGF